MVLTPMAPTRTKKKQPVKSAGPHKAPAFSVKRKRAKDVLRKSNQQLTDDLRVMRKLHEEVLGTGVMLGSGT